MVMSCHSHICCSAKQWHWSDACGPPSSDPQHGAASAWSVCQNVNRGCDRELNISLQIATKSHLCHLVCPQPLLHGGQQLPAEGIAHCTRHHTCLTLSNTCSIRTVCQVDDTRHVLTHLQQNKGHSGVCTPPLPARMQTGNKRQQCSPTCSHGNA